MNATQESAETIRDHQSADAEHLADFISGDSDADLEREARDERERRLPERVPDRGGLTTAQGKQLERVQLATDRAERRARCSS
jgi:hypothetical protein